MVLFEGGRRCPAMVFNEKILCGLGACLSETGKLDPDGVERAMRALHRFVSLAPGLGVGALAGVATAAVREARDGAAFRDRVEKETGIRLQIASGEDEARLAAQGVLFGDPTADGLVIDLGGASMEFCPVGGGTTGQGITTPLGPQRLGDLNGGRGKVRAAVERELGPLVEAFARNKSRLYLVGGAWRALARIEIDRAAHPFQILHEYRMPRKQAMGLADWVLEQSMDDLAATPAVSSSRLATMPHAALLLQALIRQFEPDEVRISGFGLREGLCYEYLPKSIQRLDPLLSTCAGQERTRARAPGFGRELAHWITAAFEPDDADEDRLISGVCHLVDTCWRAHPDYRATSCIEVVTRVNVSGSGHEGRAYMAAALLSRYKSGRKALNGVPFVSLLSERQVMRASQLGALMRLGCTIAGATPGFLKHCTLVLDGDHLSLLPDPTAKAFMGEEVDKRLTQAARALGVTAKVDLG